MEVITSIFLFKDIYKKTILMDIKKIIKKELIKEINLNPLDPYRGEVDPTKIVKMSDRPLQGGGVEDAGSAKARSEYLRTKIEKNYSKLGIFDISEYMEEQKIYDHKTISEYKKPFTFKFQHTETGEKFDGKAVYNEKMSQKRKTMVLDFINNDNRKYRLIFDKKSLQRPFLGKIGQIKNLFKDYKESYAIEGLQINGLFNVIVQKILGPATGTNPAGPVSTPPKKVGSKKVTKQTLYINLAQFFKLMNSKKRFFPPSTVLPKKQKGSSTMSRESIFDEIENLLLEQPVNNQKPPVEEIKILEIGVPMFFDLGGEKDTTKKGSLSTKTLQPVSGEITFNDSKSDSLFTTNLKKEIETLLMSGKLWVRISQKSNEVLIFSKTNTNSGDFFTIKKKGIKSPTVPDQWLGNVEVGEKAMGDSNFTGSPAKITNLKLK